MNITNFPEVRKSKEPVKVLGYINANMFLPSPVITVIKTEEGYFGIYSDLDWRKILDFETTPKVNYIEEKTEKYIRDGEYSYMINEKKILIGNPESMRSELEKVKSNFGDKAHELIQEFLNEESVRK